jgi:hypothetical protein
LRNTAINPLDICEGGFAATIDAAADSRLILAVEDSTALAFGHDGAHCLGDVGGPVPVNAHGLIAHSVLLVDPESKRTLGLAHQSRWIRDPLERGKKQLRDKRAYVEKESFKWQFSSECLRGRMGLSMERVISVCDREADVFEYLFYKSKHVERFIVRASASRIVKTSSCNLLWDEMRTQPILGTTSVKIEQRGGTYDRKGRTAEVSIRACRVTLKPPDGKRATYAPITLFAVYAREETLLCGEEQLEWMLLTSEQIDDFESASEVVRYYTLRWRIEEFHKAWKSGCGVEQRRLAGENLERLAVILAFVAVRLLQLRELEALAPESSCEEVMNPDEWRCLWVIKMKKKIPRKAPTIGWASRAIAELGGWRDTKRTGRIGWRAFWRGWLSLLDSVNGWHAALRAKM